MKSDDVYRKNEGAGYYFSGGFLMACGLSVVISAIVPSGRQPSRVYNKDVNKDGIADVIVEQRDGNKKVFLGQQDGSYKKLESLQKLVDEALQE